MLKAQLKSQIPPFLVNDVDGVAGRRSGWAQIEDILTSDFWGAIDYLPRAPYLKEFFDHARHLTDNFPDLSLSDAEWNATELRFWPNLSVAGVRTEPDVVVVSPKWVVVVEVKLHSALSRGQPWREYKVGCAIADEVGLSHEAVYYLVLTLRAQNIESTFPAEASDLAVLRQRTLYMRWSDVLALVERWRSEAESQTSPFVRLLEDLILVLRRRRSLAFSGFKFRALPCTRLEGRCFSPALFNGFLNAGKKCVRWPANRVSRFTGFLDRGLAPSSSKLGWRHNAGFAGFLNGVPATASLRVWQCAEESQ
jgi:hypothetical protein